jgi:hypothetical protein
MNVPRPPHRRVHRDADDNPVGGAHPHVCGRGRTLSPSESPVAHVHYTSLGGLAGGSTRDSVLEPPSADDGLDGSEIEDCSGAASRRRDRTRGGSEIDGGELEDGCHELETDAFSPVIEEEQGYVALAGLQQRSASSADEPYRRDRRAAKRNGPSREFGVRSAGRKGITGSSGLPVALVLAAAVLAILIVGGLHVAPRGAKSSVRTVAPRQLPAPSRQGGRAHSPGMSAALSSSSYRRVGAAGRAHPRGHDLRTVLGRTRRPTPLEPGDASGGGMVASGDGVTERSGLGIGLPSAQAEFGFER